MDDVFVIGNGFDLDIGLKSRYSDFYGSSYWPFHNPESPLSYYLESKYAIDKWLDLEMALAEYGRKNKYNSGHGLSDEKDYNLLKKSFNEFILNEQIVFNPKDSIAKELLSAIIENGYFNNIFSFNFTDLSYIAKTKLKINKTFKYEHVHGCAKDGTSILGVGDYADLRDEDYFMYKSFAKSYKPPLMIPTLLNARRIVVFGMSLGIVDYQYFDDFFNRVIVGYQDDAIGDSKEIVIFTKDESSRRSILTNLQDMTNHRLGRLFSRNYCRVYCTDSGVDDKEIASFINELITDSYENRQKESEKLWNRLL